MQFVTLTTDWQNDDFYTGVLKASLLCASNKPEIVYLSKSIKKHHIAEACFILRNTFTHFPPGSIHIIAVNAQPTPDSKMLAAQINGHYFLSADNGFVGLLGDLESVEVVEIIQEESNSKSFPALQVLAKAAVGLLEGKSLHDIGRTFEDFKKQVPLRATLENSTITGTVIYIDTYGNAFTNITKELFERIGKGRDYEIFAQSKHYKITKLNLYYAETTPGDILGIFNSINLLEIAIRNGSARDLLNLNIDSTIRVEFKD